MIFQHWVVAASSASANRLYNQGKCIFDSQLLLAVVEKKGPPNAYTVRTEKDRIITRMDVVFSDSLQHKECLHAESHNTLYPFHKHGLQQFWRYCRIGIKCILSLSSFAFFKFSFLPQFVHLLSTLISCLFLCVLIPLFITLSLLPPPLRPPLSFVVPRSLGLLVPWSDGSQQEGGLRMQEHWGHTSWYITGAVVTGLL